MNPVEMIIGHKPKKIGRPGRVVLRRLLGTALVAAVAMLALPLDGLCQVPVVVRYRCLPHLEPPWRRNPQPGAPIEGKEMLRDQDIDTYLEEPVKDSHGSPLAGGLKRKDLMENTAEELKLPENREFARQVLGQRQVFVDIADFMQTPHGAKVVVKFLNPSTWYSDLNAELDPRLGTPIGPAVCQIGDTWEADFQSRRLIDGKALRYFWDLHTLIFNRDQLFATDNHSADPAGFNTWDKFKSKAIALKHAGFMPLALSTTADSDLIWNLLAPWFWSAGADIVTGSGKPSWWWRAWWQSDLDSEKSMAVVDQFIWLRERDCLESRELSASDLADGIVRGDYTFTVMEPIVAWRGKMRWKDKWPEHIGAALPPQLGNGSRMPFLGGSLLAVLCKDGERQRHTASIQAGHEWISYLLSEPVVKKHMSTQQFIPNSDEVWAEYDNGRFKAFFDEALAGTGYTSSPSSLAKMHEAIRLGPHGAHLRMPNWPTSVEGPASVRQIYQFAYRLRILPGGNQSEAMRTAIKEALRDASSSIDAQLPSGHLWIWELTFWLVVGSMLIGGGSVYVWRIRVERRRYREWQEILEKDRERTQLLEERIRRAEMDLVAAKLGIPLLDNLDDLISEERDR